MSKRAAELTRLRALGAMRLAAETVVPALLEALHAVVPSQRNRFGWADADGRLSRFYVEGPVDQRIASRYFAEFHERREADVLPTFSDTVLHRDASRVDERSRPAFYRSALYHEVWRPHRLHTRIEAVVRGARGRPLGALALYRAAGDPPFTADDESMLAQAALLAAHPLEAACVVPRGAEYVSRRDRRAQLSLDSHGELLHLSPDALKLLMLSHGGMTPSAMARAPRRDDFATLSMLWQHHRRAQDLSDDPLTVTVDNAWGRFVFETAVLAPMQPEQAPVIHVGIQQQEPLALALRRTIDALPLSAAQREVCALLHSGLAQAEIARALSVAPSTVADHVKKIYGRLDVHSVHELGERIRQLTARQLA